MNVVKREKRTNFHVRLKNELVRKEPSVGIRGSSSLLPATHVAPRYQFNLTHHPSTSRLTPMGPPSILPRSLKRKFATSTSTKPESSSSGRAKPRVLASDSAADTSLDNMVTPRNRPHALRYISSSSRGGYSGNRSMRSNSNSVVEASVILAISEGRGMARGEIGIAAVDLKHPHLVLCQFSDTLLYTHTLTKINYFNPVEIIVPHTFCEGVQPNQLYQHIKNQYPHVNLTTVQRRHFNDAAGRQNIQTLCAPQYSAVYLQVLQKFYALTAAAAVLKYVEYIQCIVFARESLKIEYHSSENTTIIDVGTATQLELVQPLVPSAGATCCLLGVLGPTYTIGGIRALRAAILQPSCNKEFIENRLDAVQELIENDSGLMPGLQDIIKKLCDIDKVLFLCIEHSNQNTNTNKFGEAQLNQVLLLKTTMELVPNLVETLGIAETGRLRQIKMDLENPNYTEITERIKSIIQDDAHLEKGAMGSLQRCFAVKPEINGLLDVARRTYSELIEDIQKMVEQLSENYDLPLRLNQNVTKGFHIVLSIAPKNRRNFNNEDLPPVFIQVHNNGASISMTTEELVVLDQQSKESLNEIQKMSNIVISSLLKDLRPFMASLYKLCEDVAELDILLALAQASSIGSYIRPGFSNYLEIRNCVHPLLDYNSQVEPVANDIFASPEQNFTVITGPNMGGKSIYIKQIALMQIMAQIGCFLPATHAVLRLSDRIFSRIGFNDSVELNASTFVYEIKEIQHILKGLTRSSLVIIDELCRATSSEEGTSVAWAICEELILSDAFTFFTTHFMYLTRLEELYYNVVNRHTAVVEENIDKDGKTKRLIYTHKVETGVNTVEHYGLSLASKTNLPEDTIKLALELAELIVRNDKPNPILESEKSEDEILYRLNTTIQIEARKLNGQEGVTENLLKQFKQEHPQLVERLRVKNSRHLNMPRNINTTESQSVKESSRDFVTSKGSENITSSNNNVSKKDGPNLHSQEIVYQINSNNSHSAVKSSTELLNVMLSRSNDKEVEDINALSNGNDNDLQTIDDVIECTPDIITQENYNALLSDTIDPDCAKTSVNDISLLSAHSELNEDFISDSDSDISEALTHMVDEYSTDKFDKSSKHSSNSSVENLMTETIDEINEELVNGDINIDKILLTPPLDFKDV